MLAHEGARLGNGAALAHDAEVRLAVEDELQTAAYDPVIFGHDHAQLPRIGRRLAFSGARGACHRATLSAQAHARQRLRRSVVYAEKDCGLATLADPRRRERLLYHQPLLDNEVRDVQEGDLGN